MVLPAVLRDSARHPEQAVRRHCAAVVDLDPVLHSVARHLEGALDQLSAYLQMVLLGVRGDVDWARLSRLAAARRLVSDRRAPAHVLLFRVLSGGHAGSRLDRESETASGQHHRGCARPRRPANRGYTVRHIDADATSACAKAEARRGGAVMTLSSRKLASMIVGGAALLALSLSGAAFAKNEATSTEPSNHEPDIEAQSWTFSAPFGTYDNAQLQRGFQVYKDVCSNCHSMRLLSYRNLGEPGGPEFSPKAVATLAGQVQVTDGPNEKGEMFQRPARPVDHFRSPFANEQLARNANGGALPPDLSVVAKAREAGPDYIYALLTGYTDE